MKRGMHSGSGHFAMLPEQLQNAQLQVTQLMEAVVLFHNYCGDTTIVVNRQVLLFVFSRDLFSLLKSVPSAKSVVKFVFQGSHRLKEKPRISRMARMKKKMNDRANMKPNRILLSL
jgi:hypothetical protein